MTVVIMMVIPRSRPIGSCCAAWFLLHHFETLTIRRNTSKHLQRKHSKHHPYTAHKFRSDLSDLTWAPRSEWDSALLTLSGGIELTPRSELSSITNSNSGLSETESGELRRVSRKLVELQRQLALAQRELEASRLAARAPSSPNESEGP